MQQKTNEEEIIYLKEELLKLSNRLNQTLENQVAIIDKIKTANTAIMELDTAVREIAKQSKIAVQ